MQFPYPTKIWSFQIERSSEMGLKWSLYNIQKKISEKLSNK